MRKTRTLRLAVLMVIGSAVSALAVAGAQAPRTATTAASPFTYREAMVPMRDGVRLQTVILTPTGAHGPLPILLRRTPYGVPDKPYAEMPEALKALAADGYIFVIQNIRGRFKSEGTFSLAGDFKVDAGRGTVETRDGYDTVGWLVKNVPGNNGRVGIYGVSYDGYTAAATLLGPHPALKAVSEQASPADWFMNDDYHRYGALRLSYAMEYAVLEEASKTANTHFAFDKWDSYEWYLARGPVSNINDQVLHGSIPFWNETVAHPNYDAFWQDQSWAKAVTGSTVPNLNVAGFWDQEDPWGPWQIFRGAQAHDPAHTDLIVAGPWYHGGWHASVSKLGEASLGQDTSLEFRRNIEAPYFAYWLHGTGTKPAWQATTFQTGSNRWRQYSSWPPAGTKPLSLYFHADGRLDFSAPGATEAGAHRDYVSDPANPVPYRQRPISPTYPSGDWRTWESADQRFVDHRPDVLSFVSAPLTQDLTVSGALSAELFASTTGTDSDFVVKLIDVYPDNAQPPAWGAEAGPAPGQYAHSVNGYELPIAMEVRRGRFLDSYEHPAALRPGVPRRWDVPLRDHDHVFLKGHRIMVQIQSSWFPVIDRNPQTFTPNTYTARPSDFVSAAQQVYASPDRASRIVLPVVGENPRR